MTSRDPITFLFMLVQYLQAANRLVNHFFVGTDTSRRLQPVDRPHK
jgi:hypothetical protein